MAIILKPVTQSVLWDGGYMVKPLMRGPQAEKIFQQLHELHETFHEVSDAAYQAFNEGDLKPRKIS